MNIIIFDSFSSLDELYQNLSLNLGDTLEESVLAVIGIQVRNFVDLTWERTAIYFKSILANVNIETVGVIYRKKLIDTLAHFLSLSEKELQNVGNSCIELVLGITVYWCLCQGEFDLEEEICEKVTIFLNTLKNN